MARWGYCRQKLIGLIFRKDTVMDIILDQDRYTAMEYVARQTERFRFAEIYHLIKKFVPGTDVEELKITMEWLADMGLVKRIFVKISPWQEWLYYKSNYDHGFLCSRIRHDSDSQCAGAVKYRCYGLAEKIRYQYAGIKEKINHAIIRPSYDCPFIIAEKEFAIPISQEQRELLKKKIEELK